MRIVSGTHRGRKINIPKTLTIRPTTDMSKESLMNILSFKYDFFSIKALDLFSGSGNISYEFCSRGCKKVSAVEKNRKCWKFIKKKSAELKFVIKVYNQDVFYYLNKTSLTFDVIFADPPYSFKIQQYEDLVSIIFKKRIINEGGCLIIEHSDKISLKNQKNYFENRKYGGCSLSFFYL